MLSFKTLRIFANKCLFFTNMFIASKPVLYPSCIGPPRTLASLFTVVSIIRSQCFVEQNSPVRLPPKPFSSQSF